MSASDPPDQQRHGSRTACSVSQPTRPMIVHQVIEVLISREWVATLISVEVKSTGISIIPWPPPSLLFSSLCYIHYFLPGCLPPRAQAKFRRRRGERRLKHRRKQHKVTQLSKHSNNRGTSQKEARRRLDGERRRRRAQHAVISQQQWRSDQKETNRRWEDALAQKLTSLLAN